jgi:hypothetical protein
MSREEEVDKLKKAASKDEPQAVDGGIENKVKRDPQEVDGFDSSQPITTLQIRLLDNTRLASTDYLLSQLLQVYHLWFSKTLGCLGWPEMCCAAIGSESTYPTNTCFHLFEAPF